MKGDPKVIDYLNKALRHELTAVSQYWLHYRLQDDWGLGSMAKKSREESIEEMQHADDLIERILFLGGHPNLQKLDPLRIGQTPKETLECDLAAEESARALYKEAREVCNEAGDYVTMKLFETLMADEEGHIDFLETQLDLHDRIGAENYAQLNATKMEAVEE
ncbi:MULTISPECIES: bacterioferritin [Rhodobacterales]|jgi:bacterioferritin|uniref:bacterioferritin n=2 Tax=Alphaproteobacteria TaxID=28211 RepID=UPI000068B9C1|nr:MULTISPECIES: bacterioferritin [Rhodobacterales]OIQ33912.1 MAG: bacterioferritin [Roseobacter sp. MedPE-SWchi]OIQ42082.1 MAG: bacterioferritin [Roseobacter sp. MedPE-SWde]OIQ46239.1 MAG: bacterioferritin [Roseobacter sp. MedPE-SW]EAQ47441.1 Bacterioferritin [Roseobacter sp. MED193]KPD12755.1 bacterioferritin [Phaeobacter sp. 11ANDIMAR09]